MDGDGEPDALRSAMADVARGDAAALKRLYQLTSAKLFGICLRILQDRTEAEDVLQEVYLLVWRHSASYDATRASPVTWLAIIAQRKSIDRSVRFCQRWPATGGCAVGSMYQHARGPSSRRHPVGVFGRLDL
jgi:DNA-directed RNA polymerase specialized sigma24 family protein